jgi:hypothetical protein
MRWTDLKHFILPVGQFLYFVGHFAYGSRFGAGYGRAFQNPFYGAFEQFLYLFFSFAYLYFAYRYIRLKKASHPRLRSEQKKLWYAALLIRIFFILFCVHTLFSLADYISYSLLRVDLRASDLFAGLGILTFVSLIYWLGIYGFQVLIWGRKMFRSTKI